MKGATLCLGLSNSFILSYKEQIKALKNAGFNAFFTDWDSRIADYKKVADELGMIYQSIHAPFTKAGVLWHGSDAEMEEAIDEAIRCIHDAAANGIDLIVMHCYIGFTPSAGPTEKGLDNYRKIVAEAVKCGVRIAFENTEGEEYLAALMDDFKDLPQVGFCWDTGHENCYNDKDMLALYGDRLICTHLNDNLGITDPAGTITNFDDLHLLPFDGIIDWKEITARLNQHGFDGILTFELKRKNSPNRHDHDRYLTMTPETYLAEAYARACRVATYKNKND